jgi:hypothetical protein
VVCNRFVGRGSFQGFAEVWFSNFFGYWRTTFSLNFGEFVSVQRDGFSLIISEIDEVTEHKICVSYVLIMLDY